MAKGIVFRHLLAAATMSLCAAGAVQASSISIVNFSFEAVPLTAGNYAAYNLPGWTISNGGFASTYHPSATEIPSGAPDGVNVAAVAGSSSILQALAATLQANTQYTLTAAVGERTDIFSGGYTLSLLAGSTVLATDSSQILTPGSFTTSTVSYLAGATDASLGQTLSIQASALASGQTEFDNFQLTTVNTGAPEPASFLLFGLAAALLPALRRLKLG